MQKKSEGENEFQACMLGKASDILGVVLELIFIIEKSFAIEKNKIIKKLTLNYP